MTMKTRTSRAGPSGRRWRRRRRALRNPGSQSRARSAARTPRASARWCLTVRQGARSACAWLTVPMRRSLRVPGDGNGAAGCCGGGGDGQQARRGNDGVARNRAQPRWGSRPPDMQSDAQFARLCSVCPQPGARARRGSSPCASPWRRGERAAVASLLCGAMSSSAPCVRTPVRPTQPWHGPHDLEEGADARLHDHHRRPGCVAPSTRSALPEHGTHRALRLLCWVRCGRGRPASAVQRSHDGGVLDSASWHRRLQQAAHQRGALPGAVRTCADPPLSARRSGPHHVRAQVDALPGLAGHPAVHQREPRQLRGAPSNRRLGACCGCVSRAETPAWRPSLMIRHGRAATRENTPGPVSIYFNGALESGGIDPQQMGFGNAAPVNRWGFSVRCPSLRCCPRRALAASFPGAAHMGARTVSRRPVRYRRAPAVVVRTHRHAVARHHADFSLGPRRCVGRTRPARLTGSCAGTPGADFEGLVGAWPLNEGQGLVAFDATDFCRNGAARALQARHALSDDTPRTAALTMVTWTEADRPFPTPYAPARLCTRNRHRAPRCFLRSSPDIDALPEPYPFDKDAASQWWGTRMIRPVLTRVTQHRVHGWRNDYLPLPRRRTGETLPQRGTLSLDRLGHSGGDAAFAEPGHLRHRELLARLGLHDIAARAGRATRSAQAVASIANLAQTCRGTFFGGAMDTNGLWLCTNTRDTFER
jgi:hypothetical protein